jgi:putative CocE/NonD family hydrolase
MIRLHPWSRCLLGFLVAGLALTAAAGPQDKKADPVPGEVPSAKMAGLSDSGTFHLYVNEEILLRSTFTWKADGTFESKTAMESGAKVTINLTITPDKDGYWTKIDGAKGDTKIALARDGEKLAGTYGAKKISAKLKPGTILWDGVSAALFSQFVRAYDQDKAGGQTLPMLALPGTVLDVTIERKDTVERTVAGKDLKLTRYQLTFTKDQVLTLWADAAGRIFLVEVSAQQAAFVREGYESLRKVEAADPLLSKPEFGVKEELNVRVAMRDGVKLGTDVHRPDKDAKYPAILMRTPYKKEIMAAGARYYTRRGYVAVVQDCRGRFSSEGTWEPFVNEGKDGYDAIEWLAKQPWCNGKVGMIGGSYGGWVQWWAAAEAPPHLVTIIPQVSPPDLFHNLPYDYGVFFLYGSMWWLEVVETEATADTTGEKLKALMTPDYFKRLEKLPVIDLDKAILGKENAHWRRWIEHNSDDAYWQQANFHEHMDRIKIPVFHMSGWFDPDGIGSKLNYARMAALGHANQKLTLGPWSHQTTATRTLGKWDFGPEALRDLPRDYLRWFDYWLKGIENGVPKEPLVSLYVINANKWLHGEKYPLPQTRFDKWYLGAGTLTRDPPAKDSPPDRYSYDPGDPTPDPDAAALMDETTKGAKDEKNRREELLKKRKDTLVYVSEPMAEPYTIAGPLTAVLYAASSAKDTDWFVRLLSVDPKGEVFPLGGGKIRARFRESMSKPTLLEPGKVYAYTLDLWQIGIMVPKGHRLRVEVASAEFPLFSRNLNTGGHNEKDSNYITAEQTIYHDAQHPSHVVLPFIPEAADKAGK